MLKYCYTVFDTPFGWMAAAGSAAGLFRITLPQSSPDMALKLVADLIPQSVAKASCFGDLAFRLQRYFEGDRVDFSDELDLRGTTPLQREVWNLTRSIPYGETRMYGWLSRKLGRPKGARWIGQALSRNPMPIIIPCHRVIAAGGALCGFAGGLEMKRRLLELESSVVVNAPYGSLRSPSFAKEGDLRGSS
jgi:methylated-DNA-[protein]-cysteine S-methyltransferase